MIIQSQNDPRQYKAVKLENGLECLLINDSDTQKCAAAMVVDVGSYEDPSDRQGIAHFCEHMLFLGSEKYPQEQDYRDYINSNSGSCNAYTSVSITNYQFQISNQAFKGALDRFAQFFISPLFTQSGTEREMKAVDSEFNMNWKVDGWRKHLVMKQLAQEGHRYASFQIGNLKTLDFEDTREKLLQFHSKWYSSNIMKLVVLGSQPLEELEQWVREIFSPIVNKNLTPPVYNDHPFAEYGKLVKYVPVKDDDHLEVRWIVDYLHPHYLVSPGGYISHLMGHEGENSLLSLLKGEGLALELMAGPSDEMRSFSYMYCRVKLTKKGLAEPHRVLGYIFQYVNVLKERGVQEWIFDEVRRAKQLQFDFLEKSSPFQYVSSLGARMAEYPINHVLKANYFAESYDPQLLNHFIKQLGTDKIFVVLSSQEYTDQLGLKEQYFGTEYSISKIPEDIAQAIQNPNSIVREKYKKPLDVPPQNIFIPKSTEILPIDQMEMTSDPTIIYETEASTLWYKRDTIFKVPKCYIWMRIQTTDMNFGRSVHTELLTKLWLKLINIHLQELMYMADQAHLYPGIEQSPNGLTLTFQGFNDTIPLLVNQYLKKIVEFRIDDYEEFFADNYSQIKKNLDNQLREKPYIQIQSLKNQLLRDGADFTTLQQIEALQTINFKDLQQFSANWLKKLRIESLVQGNINPDSAMQLQKDVEQVFRDTPLKPEQTLEIRPVKLPANKTFNYSFDLFQEGETNSAILLHYEVGPIGVREQVLLDVMHNLIKTDFFEQLRTQEQLGYAVFSFDYEQRGVFAYEALIQSNAKSCHFVQERIRYFMANKMFETFKSLSNEKFESAKQSIRVSLLEKDYRLEQEVMRNWTQIQRHKFIFQIRQQKLSYLDTIEMKEVQTLYEDTFITNVRCLEVHANSQVHKEENDALKSSRQDQVEFAKSVNQFKRKLELYPDFYSA